MQNEPIDLNFPVVLAIFRWTEASTRKNINQTKSGFSRTAVFFYTFYSNLMHKFWYHSETQMHLKIQNWNGCKILKDDLVDSVTKWMTAAAQMLRKV